MIVRSSQKSDLFSALKTHQKYNKLDNRGHFALYFALKTRYSPAPTVPFPLCFLNGRCWKKARKKLLKFWTKNKKIHANSAQTHAFWHKL
jgi:hypothetical protein